MLFRSRYKNEKVDKLIDTQSAEVDREKRKKLVWEIERKLAEDVARPPDFQVAERDLEGAGARCGEHRGCRAARTAADNLRWLPRLDSNQKPAG